jgi:hypothetical protein
MAAAIDNIPKPEPAPAKAGDGYLLPLSLEVSQMNQRKLFIIACAICLAALGGGCFLIVFWGGELPGWLLRAELAAFCSVALVYGFFASLPTLTPWLWSRPIRGAALVCLGVAAIFVPMEFVLAALLIALGTRLTWASACELAQQQEEEPPQVMADGGEPMPRIEPENWPDALITDHTPSLPRLP